MITHCHSIRNSQFIHETDEVFPTCFCRACADYVASKDKQVWLFRISYIPDDVLNYLDTFRIFFFPMKVSVLCYLECAVFTELKFRLVGNILC